MTHIHEWISTHRKKGYRDSQIADHLRKHGYDEKHIHLLLGAKSPKKQPPSVHKHHPRPKQTAKDEPAYHPPHHTNRHHIQHKVKDRNLLVMLLLGVVTLGIYPLVWIGMSGYELRKTTKKVPDVRIYVLAIILPFLFSLFLPVSTFLPFESTVLAIILIVLTVLVGLASLILLLIYLILYGIAIEQKTNFPAWATVVLMLLIPVIGMLIVQHQLNKAL